jgi:hypothetical protein
MLEKYIMHNVDVKNDGRNGIRNDIRKDVRTNKVNQNGDSTSVSNNSFSHAKFLFENTVIDFCIKFGINASQLFPSSCFLDNILLVGIKCEEFLSEINKAKTDKLLARRIDIGKKLAINTDTEDSMSFISHLTHKYRTNRAHLLLNTSL